LKKERERAKERNRERGERAFVDFGARVHYTLHIVKQRRRVIIIRRRR